MILTQIFQIVIPIVAIIAGSSMLIIATQRKHSRQINLINQSLRPGATIQTATKIQGTIALVMHNTVIMELDSGQKIEVLKQVITRCSHEKLT